MIAVSMELDKCQGKPGPATCRNERANLAMRKDPETYKIAQLPRDSKTSNSER